MSHILTFKFVNLLTIYEKRLRIDVKVFSSDKGNTGVSRKTGQQTISSQKINTTL